MTLVFTLPDNRPAWFEDVLRCANARAGLPVRVTVGTPQRLAAFREALCSIRHLPEKWPGEHRFEAMCLLRWMVLLEFVKDWPASDWPICCLDWDVLVCAELNPWLTNFKNFDYGLTKDKTGYAAAPILLNSIRPLRTFCEALESAVAHSSPVMQTTNDMELWHRVGHDLHAWNILDVSQPSGGKVFDHNIGEDGGRFVMDGPRKKIVFENGHPYFFETNGNKVEAVVLHCWSDFKAQMGVFAREMGIAGI